MTIESHTDTVFSEDTAARFLSYGGNVTAVAGPNDLTLLDGADQAFLKTKDRPALILVHSHIGFTAGQVVEAAKRTIAASAKISA